MSGIYIHIPFCKQACHYCDFHFSTSLKLKDKVVNSLIKEIELTADYHNTKKLSSIYFGGGTPSLLEEEDLKLIFLKLREHYHWDEEIEITLEANPDDINIPKIGAWQRYGINRLSIGIQSFHDVDLVAMNRAHSAEEARRCLDIAMEGGYKDFSIDLIYGSHTTTDKMWEENINLFLDYKIDHLSSYSLTVEKGTALHHFISTGKTPSLDNEKALRQYDMLIDRMQESGYDHYEISNYAKNKKYAVHNTNYWKGVSYLGLGPSAHSYDGKSRRWNVANNMKYIKAIEVGKLPYADEVLTAKDLYNEYIMTSLRTMWGIDLEKIAEKYRGQLEQQMAKLKSAEYLMQEGSFVKLTRKGKHLADFVASELFSE